eukprot:9252752-Lingulodinium_polyedra.AAC.1
MPVAGWPGAPPKKMRQAILSVNGTRGASKILRAKQAQPYPTLSRSAACAARTKKTTGARRSAAALR